MPFYVSEFEMLSLAYAITIHKSQGSEYRAVVIVLDDEHRSIAQRHLLYTAITRGKDYVFVLATPSTLKSAVSRKETRWQRLTQLLQVPGYFCRSSASNPDRGHEHS